MYIAIEEEYLGWRGMHLHRTNPGPGSRKSPSSCTQTPPGAETQVDRGDLPRPALACPTPGPSAQACGRRPGARGAGRGRRLGGAGAGWWTGEVASVRSGGAVWRDAEAPSWSPAALNARAARGAHGGALRAHPPLGGRRRGAGAAAASGRLGPAAVGRARQRYEAAGGRGRGRPPRARHRRAAAGLRGRVDLHELIHRAGPVPRLRLRCDPCARAARRSLPQFTLTFPSGAGGQGPVKSHSLASPRVSPSSGNQTLRETSPKTVT